MPSESIWVQFAIVAIVIMAISLIWREMKKFLDEQDLKRDGEREKQRLWQEAQGKISDLRWQEFIKQMQLTWIEQDAQRIDAISLLNDSINKHIEKVDAYHDTVKSAVVVMHERTKSL